VEGEGKISGMGEEAGLRKNSGMLVRVGGTLTSTKVCSILSNSPRSLASSMLPFPFPGPAPGQMQFQMNQHGQNHNFHQQETRPRQLAPRGPRPRNSQGRQRQEEVKPKESEKANKADGKHPEGDGDKLA
jgi:hypothetical protein